MTIQHRLMRSEGFNFETRPRLKIGDRVLTKAGSEAEVVGVGLMDYAPNGPAYEIVEVTTLSDGSQPTKNSLHFAVDLADPEDDDGS